MPVPEGERETKAHNVRVSTPRWDRFGENVDAMDENRTRVLNQFIAWYNREPNSRLPQRPARD